MKKAIAAFLLLVLLLSATALAESTVVRLGDYTKIEIQPEAQSISEAELQEQIDFMLKLYAKPDENGQLQIPELTDSFARENLNCDSAEEYKQRLSALLLEEKEAEALADAKNRFLNTLLEISEIKLDADEQESLVYGYRAVYEGYAQNLQISWEDFCREYFAMSIEEFQQALHAQAEFELGSKLLLKALSEDLGIVLDEKEYLHMKAQFQEEYALADDALNARYTKEQLQEMFTEDLVWVALLGMES